MDRSATKIGVFLPQDNRPQVRDRQQEFYSRQLLKLPGQSYGYPNHHRQSEMSGVINDRLLDPLVAL